MLVLGSVREKWKAYGEKLSMVIATTVASINRKLLKTTLTKALIGVLSALYINK